MSKIKTLLIILVVAMIGMAGCEIDSVNQTVTDTTDTEITRVPCYDLDITTANFTWPDHEKWDTKRIDYKVLDNCGGDLNLEEDFDGIFVVNGPYPAGSSGNWDFYYYNLQLVNPTATKKDTSNPMRLYEDETKVAYDSININVC